MSWDVVIEGLTIGSIYALVGISFNLMYLPTNVFNFAQGELVMVGAMFGVLLITDSGTPWVVAAALIILGGGVIGAVIERLAVRPVLRRSSHATAWVITTLACSMIIANLAGRYWNDDPHRVVAPWPLSAGREQVAGVLVSNYQLAVIAVTVAIVAVVELGLRTQLGRAVRAVAEDRDAAVLQGINPERLSTIAWFCGGGLATVTGLLVAPLVFASVAMGPLYLLPGFAAAAIGGLGHPRGAFVAGLLLGMVEASTASVISPGYQQTAIFVVLLAALLARPSGLAGGVALREV